jgi:hypothetical protein
LNFNKFKIAKRPWLWVNLLDKSPNLFTKEIFYFSMGIKKYDMELE